MSPYVSFLVTILYREDILKVALKINKDKLPEIGDDYKEVFRKVLYPFLPLHCQTGPILDIEQIFEIEVIQ